MEEACSRPNKLFDVYYFNPGLLLFCPTFVWAGKVTQPDYSDWSEDPATTQTITWLTPDDQANIVQYIEAAGYNGDFPPPVKQLPYRAFGSSGYRCTATLTGLQPDTLYMYRWAALRSGVRS